MKRQALVWLFIALVTLALGVPLIAQQQSPAPAQQSFLRPTAAFTGHTAQIPMRDGQSLAADIYLPKSGARHPVVLIQTPYNKDPMHPWWLGEGRWGANSLFTDPNYAFVVVDWRGKFASKGAQVPGKQPNIGQDGFDTIAWIVKQDWSNGKVATWGYRLWAACNTKRPARIRRIWFAPCPSSCRSIWITTLTFRAACCGKSSR
ncbi:MAG: CocE/NonD family hydrolase [Acidobacteria bacterium]|nr:CocE/NonD family hydrolase [Acidobacteriota bacterium]